jgi:Tfp pilus assembly ATPase PilU
MLLWIIQISIISVIFIFLVHNLIGFFKSTLTVPKIKDLVTTPNQKYENMFNVMSSSKSNTFDTEEDANFGIESTTTTTNMKDELKNFLKQQMNTPSSTTDISSLDSMNVAPGISSFSSASSQGNYSNY